MKGDEESKGRELVGDLEERRLSPEMLRLALGKEVECEEVECEEMAILDVFLCLFLMPSTTTFMVSHDDRYCTNNIMLNCSTHVRAHTCTCTHTQTYICTHTHTHTHS